MNPIDKKDILLNKLRKHAYSPSPFSTSFGSEDFHLRKIVLILCDEVLTVTKPNSKEHEYWKQVREFFVPRLKKGETIE